MSAFNNNTSLNNTGLDNRDSNLASTGINDGRQLNENHGIAATGLNEPFTHATAPTTQGTTAERHADNLNYSGPPISGNKLDQAGSHNPSHTNRTAGTGIPPVNTAEHAKRNVADEALAGATGHHHNTTGTGLTGDHHHNTTGSGLTGTSSGLTGDHHHNTTGAGLTGAAAGAGLTGDHHHNTTGAPLTGNHPHNATGSGFSGAPGFGSTGVATEAASAERHLSGDHHHNTTGTGLTGDHHHNTTGTGLTGDHHHNTTTGTGLTGDHHHNSTTGERHHDLSNVTAKHGDHGASHHHAGATGNNSALDEKAARIGTDATHPTAGAANTTGVATGAAAAPGAINDGVRHAGEPQHDGLLPKKDRHRDENTAETGNHPTTSDGVEGKPSVGDKIKGNLEKVAGKISGNEAKVIAGDNKAHGRV